MRHKTPEQFYARVLEILLQNNLPFMVGGTYAFSAYTGIVRPTKDIDIMSTVEDFPAILKVFDDAGYKTVIHELNWIAKVYEGDMFADVIYAEKNGLVKVEKSWLEKAHQGEILGHQVKLVPPEEMIRSKAYIQHRERHDGADVAHLILRIGKSLDWKEILQKMEPHYEIILGHILTFIFVYPSEKDLIPKWVLDSLLQRAKDEFAKPALEERTTRGLLISSQYTPGVTKWGYQPIMQY